ncbi:diol dehydratase small subunit [Alkalibacterium sp. f15]|uniref:diol dehydratase small subunit n=1 Tax=Alkalibacterium sp. f15 TaxID=3414029 RepID=UPI003BF85F54
MSDKKLNAQKDYPLAQKRPDLLKTPTGKKLNDITLEKVMNGEVKPEDVRISPETLELQAQISDSDGRKAVSRNFRRAAELIAIPDKRLLEIYNALRPYRSSREDLIEIAEELEEKYDAEINGAFIREAAEVYDKRKKLRKEE